jgi:transposase-like protein
MTAALGIARKRTGRPSIELTEALRNKIVLAIRAGNYVETAARLNGVSKSLLYEWLKRGNIRRPPEGCPYVALVEAIQEALAYAEARDLEAIRKAATKDWKAAAWRLERRFPKRWAGRYLVHQLAEQKAKQDVQLLLQSVSKHVDPGTLRLVLDDLEAATVGGRETMGEEDPSGLGEDGPG